MCAKRLTPTAYGSSPDNPEVFDFDPYSQALSKLERGFALDLEDVHNMVRSGKVEPAKLRELFDGIEPELFRFPAVDPPSLRAAPRIARFRRLTAATMGHPAPMA